MSYLIPKSFWSMPTIASMMEDDDWGYLSNSPSGLAIAEDEKNVFVDAHVPGVDPKDIEITFEKGVVKISAASKQEEKEGRKVWRRSQSMFSYQFSVPADVDMGADPEAQIKNGVVHLTFKKSAKAMPRKIAIKSE